MAKILYRRPLWAASFKVFLSSHDDFTLHQVQRSWLAILYCCPLWATSSQVQVTLSGNTVAPVPGGQASFCVHLSPSSAMRINHLLTYLLTYLLTTKSTGFVAGYFWMDITYLHPKITTKSEDVESGIGNHQHWNYHQKRRCWIWKRLPILNVIQDKTTRPPVLDAIQDWHRLLPMPEWLRFRILHWSSQITSSIGYLLRGWILNTQVMTTQTFVGGKCDGPRYRPWERRFQKSSPGGKPCAPACPLHSSVCILPLRKEECSKETKIKYHVNINYHNSCVSLTH